MTIQNHWRSIFFTPVVLLGAALSKPGPALAQHQHPDVRRDRLAKLLEPLPHPQTQVSAAVMSLADGKIVYERNADTVMIPASNQKIVSGAVALDVLGHDHQFETKLLLRGEDLLIVGGGDPALGDPKLAAERGRSSIDVFADWANILGQRGITEINGDIIVDDRAFDHQWVHPSWEQADLTTWYAAPVGALNFNDNCIEVTLRPTSSGQLAHYEVFPRTDWIKIVNRCKTGTKNNPWIHRPSNEPLYQLRGQCSRRSKLQPVSVTDPGIFSGEVFKTVLESYGIEVIGEVRREQPVTQRVKGRREDAAVHRNVEAIATHSTPIADVLTRSMRDSQNLFAECLFKSVARCSARAGPPGAGSQQGGWQSGGQVILQTLKTWGIDTTGMVVADGSGLSRDNRVSAGQLVQILRRAYLDPKNGNCFINSMSLNAAHGTLQKRMKDIPRRVWGKTGYMRGIRSMSGYVMAEDHRWYAFAAIFNNIPGGTAPYNKIHDNLCRALVDPKLVIVD